MFVPREDLHQPRYQRRVRENTILCNNIIINNDVLMRSQRYRNDISDYPSLRRTACAFFCISLPFFCHLAPWSSAKLGVLAWWQGIWRGLQWDCQTQQGLPSSQRPGAGIDQGRNGCMGWNHAAPVPAFSIFRNRIASVKGKNENLSLLEGDRIMLPEAGERALQCQCIVSFKCSRIHSVQGCRSVGEKLIRVQGTSDSALAPSATPTKHM